MSGSVVEARADPPTATDDHVRRLVDAAPPLSTEQADRLAALLVREAAKR